MEFSRRLMEREEEIRHLELTLKQTSDELSKFKSLAD